MVKKQIGLLTVMCLCLSLSACDVQADKMPENVVFAVSDYPLQVTCPAGWEQEKNSNFDLQCLSEEGDIAMSIYCYYDIDLPEALTSRQALFEHQNQMVLDLRKNVTLVENAAEREYEDKQITSVLYSAEKEGVKNYYFMNLVSLNNNDCFAWVLFTGVPSEITAQRKTIEQILETINSTAR